MPAVARLPFTLLACVALSSALALSPKAENKLSVNTAADVSSLSSVAWIDGFRFGDTQCSLIYCASSEVVWCPFTIATQFILEE